jgi:N-ethylmaleimide reductase
MSAFDFRPRNPSIISPTRLAYLHIVEPAAGDPLAFGKTPDIGYFRRLWRGPLRAKKGDELARANATLRGRDADLAQLCLANADLPERFRRGAGLNLPDRTSFSGGPACGDADYPSIGS